MLDGTPSRTAWRVARRRAAHQILDQPTVFIDPIALRIVGETAESFLNDERERTMTARGLRAFMAVRSRIAEDTLAAAVSEGVGQYVVLGAGLDTLRIAIRLRIASACSKSMPPPRSNGSASASRRGRLRFRRR